MSNYVPGTYFLGGNTRIETLKISTSKIAALKIAPSTIATVLIR